MDQDTSAHILLTIAGAAISGLITAVGFMAWTRANFQRIEERIVGNHSKLEEWGKENHDRIEHKIDKNFETLDNKIVEYHKELLADLSGIGTKVGINERNALRRYHNMSQAVMLASPADKENEVSRLLKEEAS